MLTMLLLWGLMGMVGQGVRTVVGLKKLSDMYDTAPSEVDRFNAARIVIGLMIGFLAGVIGAMTSDVFNYPTLNREALLYLAGVGYIGVDVIEAFSQKLGAGRAKTPLTGGPGAETASTPPIADDGAVAGDREDRAVRPASHEILVGVMPQLTATHRHFPGSVSWALTAEGVAVDGGPARGTPGEPTTVRGIWRRFGPQVAAASAKYGVPVELIVATIATESGGNPSARRMEPQINDQSVGLMQTLVSTARSALHRKSLQANDLLDPATSIEAGTAYIAQQRHSTHFDPPLVAAAYNAGSLRRDAAEANRWQLHCFPRHTGRHVDHFVGWFNDCMLVAAAEAWGTDAGAPSFAAELGGGIIARPVPGSEERERARPRTEERPRDVFGPDFPPLPNFLPLVSTEDRQAIFGAFHFAPDPQPGNPEHIRVTDDWAHRNIKRVSIPVQHAFGKPGPFEIDFHALAEAQLVALWLEWERQGLLDRVLTFGGGYVPRFMRKSRSRLSNHAFGTAFDINAAFNPMGARPALVGQKGSVRELVPIANKFGFFWGGHFKTRPDGMHFEVAELLPPAELNTLAA
jgi:hypothetical protein